SADDLSAFVDIQKENGDAYADTEALVPKLREKLTDIMMKMHLSFFEGNDIENKLLALEVLKEKFAGQEGKQWNVNEMTPEELTRPLRIQLMDSSIRYMERKIETQQKKLEVRNTSVPCSSKDNKTYSYFHFQTALEKSKANRERVQNIQNERVKLNAIMEQQLAEFKEIKPQILDLQKSLIDS
ncbi:hypothetical protein KR074_010699, partial [Drosophila pseudoananassae]